MSQKFMLSDQPNYGNWSIQVDAYVSTDLQKKMCIGEFVSLFLIQNICCGYSKECLNETVLLSTQNICLN